MSSNAQRRTLVAAALQCADADKPIRVVISNDSQTSHGYRLVHTKDAIDLSRAAKGLPLLVSHDQTQLPVGRVNGLKLDGSQLIGELAFGARGADIEADMRAGIITDVSVGADYDPRDSEDAEGVTVINRWRPMEVSAVSIGAIEGANVMNEHKPKVIDMKQDERLTGLESVFAAFDGPSYDKMHLQAIREGWSVEQATQKLLNHFAAQEKKTAPDGVPNTASGRVEMQEDERDKFIAGAQLALRVRSGQYSETEEGRSARRADMQAMQNNELAGLSLIELARESLHLCGISTRGLNARRVADLALRGTPQTWRFTAAAGHTSSDFTSLISTTANKILAAGYEEAEESWRAWTSVVNLSNFQQHQFPNLSSFGDLARRYEGGAYKHGDFSDKHELMTLAEYGRRFSIDRQTIINDDLNAFTRIPLLMGRAAARNVGDLVYAVLTTGTTATMNEDSVALFNAATHGNYVTAGAAPSVTTVNAGFTSMATRTDPGGATIGVRPAFLICPIALEATSRVLVASVNDPAATTPEVPNPYRGRLEVVSDYRLDAANANGWYLAARPGQQVETVAVGFLDGEQNPSLEEEITTERPGIIYTVMHDCAAAALDWRGLYYNDGVT